MAQFKYAIQIGTSVTDIISLPCIYAIYKQQSTGTLLYELYGDQGEKKFALFSDWLCLDYEGQWHILTNKEYNQSQLPL